MFINDLQNCRTLVLNADFQPLSYFPLSLWNWQESIKAVFLNKVNVVSEYDFAARSPNKRITIPSVVALKNIAPMDRSAAFTRFNVFLRDNFTCQYCESRKSISELTFDHIIPRSKGGKTSWKNVVAACKVCNLKKGNKTLDEIDLKLKRKPTNPSVRSLQVASKFIVPDNFHDSWRDFLYRETNV